MIGVQRQELHRQQRFELDQYGKRPSVLGKPARHRRHWRLTEQRGLGGQWRQQPHQRLQGLLVMGIFNPSTLAGLDPDAINAAMAALGLPPTTPGAVTVSRNVGVSAEG
jgi:hypothetical protein